MSAAHVDQPANYPILNIYITCLTQFTSNVLCCVKLSQLPLAHAVLCQTPYNGAVHMTIHISGRTVCAAEEHFILCGATV
jgi:hypothetical protein